jgi:hypothetical protein
MRSTHAALLAAFLSIGVGGACGGSDGKSKDPNYVCRPMSSVGTNMRHEVCTPRKRDDDGGDAVPAGRTPAPPRPAPPPPSGSR